MKELLMKVTEMMKPNPVYLVGGCVRDYVLGIKPKDYDFCTPANPDEIERLVKASGKRAYCVGKRFGTIGCKVDGLMIEITTFRTEKYKEGNRKPDVEYVKDITEDLSRRDFTINAMAIKLVKGNIKIIDPFGGQADLKNAIIRTVGNAKLRFKDDPLRILRAIRFASRFNFEIEKDTYKRIQHMAVDILNISKERWVQELDKILLTEDVHRGLYLLWDSNLFKYMIPELSLQFKYEQNSKYHKYLLHQHTMIVVSICPKDIILRWAALLHDIAKPFTRTENPKGYSNYINHELLGAKMANTIGRNLMWNNERRIKVVQLIKEHLEENSTLKAYDNMGKKE